MAASPSNTFVAPPHSVTIQGAYEPFELQVSRGQIMGHENIKLFGYTTVLGSTAFGPLWEGLTGSGGAYPYPASAVVMTLTSSSASDTAVSILIEGLGAGFVLQTETVALNGTSNVNTTKNFLRINRMSTVAGNAVGNVTAINSGTTYAKITAGIGDTQMSIFTVPANFTFYQTNFTAGSNTSTTSGAYIRKRTYIIDNANGGIVQAQAQSVFVQSFELPITFPIAFPEKTDIQWQLQGSGGAGAAAYTYISGVVIKNDCQIP
jgi:hypothetical protein